MSTLVFECCSMITFNFVRAVLFCGAGKLGALSYETRTLLNLYKVITGLTLWGWPNVGRPML